METLIRDEFIIAFLNLIYRQWIIIQNGHREKNFYRIINKIFRQNDYTCFVVQIRF